MRDIVPAFALIATLAVTAAPASAGWTLDPEHSAITYVSIKSKDIPENNYFHEMRGQIDDRGQATLILMLDSVETLIPIRNERMREILFETANYKEATLKAQVDPKLFSELAPGQVKRLAAEGQLSLRGQTQNLTLSFLVGRLDKDRLMVATAEPVLIQAGKFSLSPAVEKLREIAGLPSISEAVPVTFVGTFVQTPAKTQ
ncbi:YceI family protein [Caldichromatium japonicum]|uniref:YceI family protein n=1 Tax=Caldichromatium japonicum TaxID=2699430 RepID=A0A6G7VDE9_9GAMM|nr:YceI family protein [Caldichromatium japonicum]QIK37930.1 YceI family protein [Caldichromatium japonicum]